MSGTTILSSSLAPLLALGAAFCFALALILTQYGLRTVPSWRSPLYTIGEGHTSRCHLAVEPERRAHPHLPIVEQVGAEL